MLTIVCGPPLSGKTTWAKARAGGKPVLDWDELWSEMTDETVVTDVRTPSGAA